MPDGTININIQSPAPPNVVLMSEGSTLNINNNYNLASSPGRAEHPITTSGSASPARVPQSSTAPASSSSSSNALAVTSRAVASFSAGSSASAAASPSASSSKSRPDGSQQHYHEHRHFHAHIHAHAHYHYHEHHHTVRFERGQGSKGSSQQGSKHASGAKEDDDRLERNKRRRYD